MKIAFLDRDGTIINDYADDEWRYIKEPEFIEGAIDAMKALKALDYEIIILTNQYIINRGIISIEQYNEFTKLFVNVLLENNVVLKDIFFCPHTKEENCNCFKPRTGLYEQALSKYPLINPTKSFIVGDSMCDIELGHKLRMKTFGINLETNQFPYIKIKSLAEVLQHLG